MRLHLALVFVHFLVRRLVRVLYPLETAVVVVDEHPVRDADTIFAAQSAVVALHSRAEIQQAFVAALLDIIAVASAKYHRKLVAAYSEALRVVGLERSADDLGGFSDHTVPERVPEIIVDELEIVHIKHYDPDGRGVLGLVKLVKPLLKRGAVADSGKSVRDTQAG